MSLRQQYAAWEVVGLSSSERVVLVKLADFANDEGKNCYPTIPTLAKYTCLAEITVTRTIKSLEDKQLLNVDRGVGRKRSEYTLTLPEVYLKEYDMRRAKRKLKTVGEERDKIIECRFDQLGNGTDTPF